MIDMPTGPAQPLENWAEALKKLTYGAQTVTITDQDISGVDRRELTGAGWSVLESAPDSPGGAQVEMGPEEYADAIRDALLTMAENLLADAGHTAQFKGKIYGILLEHIRSNFLEGASLGLAELHHLETTWRMLARVEQSIAETPGLVAGMVRYGDQ